MITSNDSRADISLPRALKPLADELVTMSAIVAAILGLYAPSPLILLAAGILWWLTR